ncbi:nucleotide disphospho-sugar-binding domain-containing protein [Curtobacterium sp. MCPF17_011]|uniref:nucleotide disphospho-sugar-binding domain-containing protein n=1 Tax=Curtobacterium sp. MCPF17_011 TaxID=2175652 RepID=UPI001C64B499|nr:nucleotide disphospho-sugar-binding domain-containing protein [Curtobacterium sp. MCPF17_011]
MRIAFAANPLPGHIIPMIPLMRAALAAGHHVAVITAAAASSFIAAEASPDIDVLSAGLPTLEAMQVMRRQTGVSPATEPRPDVIAEYFAVRRVGNDADDAVRVARAWQPDVVVSESSDHVGPYVAEALSVPFFRHTYGPERSEAVRIAMAAAVDRASRDRGVVLPAVTAWIDAYPSFLEDAATQRPGQRISMRPEPHRRHPSAADEVVDLPEAADGRRRVLVTMGTVFTDQHLLDRVIASIRATDLAADLVVTAVNGVGAVIEPGSAVTVLNVPFRALTELLDAVDVVVTVGGAGTVLGALTLGVPMVVMPQGADHEVNAARAVAAGSALVERDPVAIGPVLRRLLQDDRMALSARWTAARIGDLPPVTDALARLEALSTDLAGGAVRAG